MKKVLEDSQMFTVDVCTHPKPNKELPKGWVSIPFPPDLSKYHVLLINYNGPAWPKELQKQTEDRVKAAQLGVVIVHAANNSFATGWDEYKMMIGMGWYNPKHGERLYLDEAGKEIRVPTGKGDGPGHRYTGKFTVTIRDGDHPITKGMPPEWMHAGDELYDNMRGPIKNIQLLATAWSKGTKVHEPMIWTISYGMGRVFHTPMGHDVGGMRCVGFITTLIRGAEWAATAKVTYPIPKDFPTAKDTSQIPLPPLPELPKAPKKDKAKDAKVQGKVMLDGAPLKAGTITFKPADGKTPITGARIENGNYSLDLAAGKMGVEISSPKVTGKKTDFGKGLEIAEELLPPRYNSQSTLVAEVRAGKNTLNFDLTSKR
jgi:hypothetical protein